MKKIRFSALVLCIIFLVVLVYSGSEKGDLEKESDELKSLENANCKIMSILGKVYEYQNMFLMYREMNLAVPEENKVLRKSALGKLDGFLYKLDRGNDFMVDGAKIFTDDGITIKKNKLMYEFVQNLLDPEVNKIRFEITSIKLEHIIPKGDSEYAIDCRAFIEMECHIVKDHNQTFNMRLTVDHMKSCEPD
jgi:hypothetical protein